MTAFEINKRYQKLMDEGTLLLQSVQQGTLLDSEAAIAMADLRERMNCLQQATPEKIPDRSLPFAQTFSMDV